MSERILIVDDEPDIVELLSYNLERAGYAVATAGDGATAFAEIGRQRLDLILLDLMLPDIAGTEICRRLKKSPATEAIPVVMITARCEKIDRALGFELGADDYITKPFSPRELVARVQAVLRRVKMGARVHA